jgi:hypothetical protein
MTTSPTVDSLEYKLLHAKIIVEALQQHIRSSAEVTHEIVSVVSENSADTLRRYMLETHWLTPFNELISKTEEAA